MRKWRATANGALLTECELIKSKAKKNDIKWIFNNGNSYLNEKFIDTCHGWFDSKTDAEKHVIKLRKQEQNGDVQIV